LGVLLSQGSPLLDALSPLLADLLTSDILNGRSHVAGELRRHLLLQTQHTERVVGKLVDYALPEWAEGIPWTPLLQVFPQLFLKLHGRSSAQWTKLVIASRNKDKGSKWMQAHAHECATRYQHLQDVRARTKSGNAQTSQIPKSSMFVSPLSMVVQMPSKEWRGKWQDAIIAICIQKDLLAIRQVLHKIYVEVDLHEDPKRAAAIGKMQTMIRGKKARKQADHMKKLATDDFKTEYYDHVVSIQRLARQYFARKEMHARIKETSEDITSDDSSRQTHQKLLVSPAHKKIMAASGARRVCQQYALALPH